MIVAREGQTGPSAGIRQTRRRASSNNNRSLGFELRASADDQSRGLTDDLTSQPLDAGRQCNEVNDANDWIELHSYHLEVLGLLF